MDEPSPIDPRGPTLVYVQVADHLTAKISSGELRPGARLPAERHLAEFYGVAYDTVRRATELLRRRGLIITVHGRGTFVTEPAPADDPPADAAPSSLYRHTADGQAVPPLRQSQSPRSQPPPQSQPPPEAEQAGSSPGADFGRPVGSSQRARARPGSRHDPPPTQARQD